MPLSNVLNNKKWSETDYAKTKSQIQAPNYANTSPQLRKYKPPITQIQTPITQLQAPNYASTSPQIRKYKPPIISCRGKSDKPKYLVTIFMGGYVLGLRVNLHGGGRRAIDKLKSYIK